MAAQDENAPELPGLNQEAELSEDDWFAKRIEISELFSSTHPVREVELFNGRTSQIRSVMHAIFQAGQHAIVYGDRGVGKTSLVNAVSSKVFANSKYTRFFSVQCYDGDDYVRIWERALKRHQWADGTYAFDDIDDAINPDSLFDVISRFNPNNRPVFIFDEFDRIEDSETKLRMAETIKLLSDRSEDATIVIVGVGRTIRDLLAGHESVARALKQIEMPRMSAEECHEVVNVRLSRVGMTIDSATLKTIVWLARGMPGFVHLLGMYAALEAVEHKSLHIGQSEFRKSLETCLEEVAESTRQAYARAVQSARPNNLLQQTLLACAMASADEFGRFMAASVREPLSRILRKERDIPDFSRHIATFCDPQRGPILEKDGGHKNYRYRFVDPMMQSYVITRGLKEKLLTYG